MSDERDRRLPDEVEGADRVPGDFSTKEEAVAIGRARALADETEHVIHKNPAPCPR